MASAVTYEGALARSTQDDATTEGLFAGQKLWFSHTVPQRQWFIQNAELNGATVTSIDTQADIVLFDHARKNAPPGSFSYKYVELSVRNGVLEDLDAHRIASGSRVERPVGSVRTATKGSRNAYTDAEDQLLWNWVKPYIDAGGQWKGNEIYKQLEKVNPRHTFQSWRDRWIKHTQFQNRQVTAQVIEQTATETPQPERVSEPSPKRRKIEEPARELRRSDQTEHQTSGTEYPQPNATNVGQSNMPAKPLVKEEVEEHSTISEHDEEDVILHPSGFTRRDADLLMEAAPSILVVDDPSSLNEAWAAVAEQPKYSKHTSNEWRTFFENYIVPEYRRRHRLETEEELNLHLDNFLLEQQTQSVNSEHSQQEGEHSDIASIASTDHAEQEKAATLSPQSGRPPEPNESRKRSQGRGTQSESTQSQPTSQNQSLSQIFMKTSQSAYGNSQNASTRSLPNTPHRKGSASVTRRTSHSPAMLRLREVSPTKLTTSKRFDRSTEQGVNGSETIPLNQKTDIEIKRALLEADVAVQIASKRGSRRTDSQEQSNEDWIPPIARKISPLFFSDHSKDSEGTLDNNGNDDERLASPIGHSATNATESQPFETAPERLRFTQFYSQSSLSELDDERKSQLPNETCTLRHIDDHNFDTAPTQLQANFSMSQLEEGQHSSSLEHQIQSSHAKRDFIDDQNQDFLIPPPEGGWSDNEDEIEVQHLRDLDQSATNQEQSSTSIKPNLPHQDTSDENDDVEDWITRQKARYGKIGHTVMDEICIQALEATSLQLDVASSVVYSLARSYEKGKHPAIKTINRFVDDVGNPRKDVHYRAKEMRHAVAKMVDELMITNQRGVWTKQDDQDLLSTNAKSVEKVEMKHGEDGVRLRFEYLNQLYQET